MPFFTPLSLTHLLFGILLTVQELTTENNRKFLYVKLVLLKVVSS